jgi:hypothetical protein
MSEEHGTRGVMYVAVGKKYIQSAIRSAQTVRKHNPGLSVHLFGNWEECGFDFSRSPEPFTSVAGVDSPYHHSKVDYMSRTPFERTLYLDTDTRVLGDITPLFDLLERFEIALAHAPNRVTRLKNWRIPIPVSFPEFNSGVILYGRTQRVLNFLHDWTEAFHLVGSYNDQLTLRELIWLSDLRIDTLPPEYNLRHVKYLFLWNEREAKAKILHLTLYHEGLFWKPKRALKAFLRRRKKSGAGA